MTAVRALVWEIFARYRWVLTASALYFLLLCLVAPLLPSWPHRENSLPMLLAPLTLGLTFLIVAIGYGEETRLEGKVGGFPARLLLLPVSSSVLAAVPLLLALVILSTLWSMLAVWVLRPFGVDVPVFWPGLFSAAFLAWILAISWTPMFLPWVRMAFFGLGFFALFLTGPVLHELVHSEAVLVLVQLGLWLGALALAVVGISKSRSGAYVAEGVFRTARSAASDTAAATAPFRTPLRALLWLEWRLHGWPVVYMSLFYLGILLPVVLVSVRVLNAKPFLFEVIANPTFRALGPAWTAAVWFLFTPLIYVLCGGGGAGVYGQTPAKFGLPMFVGVQPVSNEKLLHAKWLAAALYLLVMWVMLLACTAAWAVLDGHAAEMAERLAEVCGSPGAAVLVSVAAAVAVYAVTYLVFIAWMWMGLFGSLLGAIVPACLNMLAVSLGIYLYSRWQPEWLFWFEVALWAALAFKLVALAYGLLYNLKRRLLSLSTLACLLGVWLAVAVPLAGALTWLCDQGYIPALAVVTLLPLAQTLAAPAALHRGRHGAWA